MLKRREKIFIKNQNSLLFLLPERISSKYWDDIWQGQDIQKMHIDPEDRLMRRVTQKFLPDQRSRLIEAGCGNGVKVRLLTNLGYDVLGIDYAEKTVATLNRTFPELNVQLGDVTNTGLDGCKFDGYWSVGVIEHFPDSYVPVAAEAFRILKQNGFVFISFPHMSPLRKLKVNLGLYPSKPALDSDCRDRFNQYALDKNRVIKTFEDKGFKLRTSYTYNGCLGWLEEIPYFSECVQKLSSGKGKVAKIIRFVFNRLSAPVMSHAILLVFQKA